MKTNVPGYSFQHSWLCKKHKTTLASGLGSPGQTPKPPNIHRVSRGSLAACGTHMGPFLSASPALLLCRGSSFAQLPVPEETPAGIPGPTSSSNCPKHFFCVLPKFLVMVLRVSCPCSSHATHKSSPAITQEGVVVLLKYT